tara:strand:- start:198 stop:509 length:312 start_codon:yes stop_codon:yes gene_type:complete
LTKFLERLTNVTKATSKQKKRELWDVEGILNNQLLKFDLRPLNNNTKGGSFKTKADKMVFDVKNQFIIVDIEELHQYLKDNKSKILDLKQLVSSLEWNIILPK